MRIKKSILLFFISLFLFNTSCADYQQAQEKAKQEKIQQQQRKERNKRVEKTKGILEIALESNINYREINAPCGFFGILGQDLTAKVLLIPLKEEVVKSLVAYKAALDGLESNEEKQLLRRTQNEFLSKQGTFIVAIINNSTLKAGKNQIYFKDVINNIFLTNESGEKYEVAKHTHNLEKKLNPGFNLGYIHFKNFRQEHDGFTDTYTVEFNNFNLVCENGDVRTTEWSFLFDDSEVPFLALIEEGWTNQDIRDKYIPETYAAIGLETKDILNLIKFALILIR